MLQSASLESNTSCDLLRLNELRAHVRDSNDPDAYFRDFENSLREIPPKLKQFRDIEAELQLLDSVAWKHLKAEAVPYLTRRDPHRGWEQLFNILNQAKAYNFMVSQNHKEVCFVPRVVGQKTPDLQGRKGPLRVLCEVKTINISKDEASYRASGQARGVTLALPDGIFRKLKSDMETASEQMRAYDAAAKQILYCIVNFDDHLHEYADDYRPQLEAYVRDGSDGLLEVVFDIKPAFYSAMA